MKFFSLRKIASFTFCLCCAPCLLVAAPDNACAQSVQLQTQSSEIYANMPFRLSVVVSDFDESPQPEIMPFDIQDADVKFIGVSPRVSSMTTIINGRRSSKKDVTFVFDYQITPQKEGTYRLPVIVAKQGAKEASSEQPVTFTAKSVQTTNDMRIAMQLPERKLWVGETFDAHIAWYLRKDVSSQVFDLPILRMPETFDVEEPDNVPTTATLPLSVGSRQIAFPYTRDNVIYNGIEYTRFLIDIRLTPLKSGTITLEPAKVLAELESGSSRDMWGFPRANYQLFRAEDTARTLVVRDLPQSSRPATFANAMGSDYAIAVTADRTIVKAGDPIILTIDISSPASMDGLILPPLSAAGLNDQLFGISNDEPIGENIRGAQNRNIKRFTVPVRIKSERVTEIPPLAFSYFNPASEEFTTVRSQPIALSVTAVDKVSAGDVFSVRKDANNGAQTESKTPQKDLAQSAPAIGTLDLGLMTPQDGKKFALSSTQKRAVRIAIYLLPFCLWFGLSRIRKLRARKADNAPQRDAVLTLSRALKNAESQDAKTSASDLTNALNQFLNVTQTDRKPFKSLMERIDVEAYNPNATIPLSPSLLDDIKKTVRAHIAPNCAKWLTLLICLFAFLGIMTHADTLYAQNAQDTAYAQAADAYHKALQTRDRAERLANFKRAEMQFEALSKQNPHNEAYDVNAGNAALGAADFGAAALHYKRALTIDPNNEQARTNYAYIRSVQGEDQADDAQVLTTTFFLSNALTPDLRLLIAACLFALTILLIIPWSSKNRRLFIYLASIPAILWLWVILGMAFAPAPDEAVVMQETFLKTADNIGASNAAPRPAQPGESVKKILTERNGWCQIQLVSGQQGWVTCSAIERIDFDTKALP